MFDQLLVMRCAWTPARRILICLPVWLALCVLISPINGQFNSTENPTALNNEFLKLQPQHLSAQELAQALQLAIGNQGSLTVLDSRDTVLVAGPPEILQRAVRMMEQVDTPRAQVRIAVYVFDVPLEDSKTTSHRGRETTRRASHRQQRSVAGHVDRHLRQRTEPISCTRQPIGIEPGVEVAGDHFKCQAAG